MSKSCSVESRRNKKNAELEAEHRGNEWTVTLMQSLDTLDNPTTYNWPLYDSRLLMIQGQLEYRSRPFSLFIELAGQRCENQEMLPSRKSCCAANVYPAFAISNLTCSGVNRNSLGDPRRIRFEIDNATLPPA